MADISAIRNAIATNLSSIPGLRTSGDIPDNPSPPIGVVSLNTIDYNQAMKQGLTIYSFTVMVIVGRASEREAQRRLDDYCENTGASSVKSAIELDRSLGGNAFDCVVQSMTSIGSLQLNDQTYLAADFQVAVYA
jgi:hypothetical protein